MKGKEKQDEKKAEKEKGSGRRKHRKLLRINSTLKWMNGAGERFMTCELLSLVVLPKL